MKVSHISPSYKPAYCYGGPTQSVSLLCEALTEANVLSIEVLTTTANGNLDLPPSSALPVQVDGVSTYYFPRLSKDHSHFCPKLLFHLLQKPRQQAHILHIHSWWNLVSMLSCLLAKWKRLPVVLSPRGMLSDYSFHHRKSPLKWLLHQTIGAKLLRYCHIHCTSEQERRELLQFQDANRISVIPNFIDLRVSTKGKRFNTDDKCFKMIFLSRIDPKKGLELLFHALSKLNFRWSLTIAGTGNADYLLALQQLAKELGISDAITWWGSADRSSKYQLMAAHDLLVLFSYNENFGNVILESLLMGTAVAISESVALADEVKRNDIGWISKLEATDIAKNLYLAFRDGEKRERIRAAAPSLIRKNYNQALLTQQYLQLYQRML